MRQVLPKKVTAGSHHRVFGFDRAMEFRYYRCGQLQASAVAPQLSRDRSVEVSESWH